VETGTEMGEELFLRSHFSARKTRTKMGECHFFRSHFWPGKQERKWLKAILSSKIIEPFVGAGAIILFVSGCRISSLNN